MTYPSKFVSKVSEIPVNTKFLVMYNDTYSEAGYYKDDASTTRTYVRTVTFESEELMLEWIKSETQAKLYITPRDPKEILIIPYSEVQRVEVETRVVVNRK